MKRFKFILVLLMFCLVAVSTADAQRTSLGRGNGDQGDRAESGRSDFYFSMQGSKAQLDTLVGVVQDTMVGPYLDVWGADVVGFRIDKTDLLNADDVAIHFEGSFDGVIWSGKTVIDTLLEAAAATDENLVFTSQAAANGLTVGSFNGYKFIRLILDPITGAAPTDSLQIAIRPYVLFKNR